MNKQALLGALGAALVIGTAGCGGGGGSSTPSGGGGTTGGTGGGGTTGATGGGGTTSNLLAKFNIQEVGGVTTSAITASATPQTVTLNVNGANQTYTNVVAPYNIAAGQALAIIKHGSQLLNIQIANPAAGLSFANSAIHPPITADGVLTTSVAGESGALVIFTTPPATWSGFQFPNGLAMETSVGNNAPSSTPGSGSVSGNVTMPVGSSTTSGTCQVTYTTLNNNLTCALSLANTSSTFDLNASGPVTSTNGVTTGNWDAVWLSTPTTFTTARFLIGFK